MPLTTNNLNEFKRTKLSKDNSKEQRIEPEIFVLGFMCGIEALAKKGKLSVSGNDLRELEAAARDEANKAWPPFSEPPTSTKTKLLELERM